MNQEYRHIYQAAYQNSLWAPAIEHATYYLGQRWKPDEEQDAQYHSLQRWTAWMKNIGYNLSVAEVKAFTQEVLPEMTDAKWMAQLRSLGIVAA